MGNNNEMMSEVEIWKPIKGYEGLYEVSSLGRVRSILNGRNQIKKYSFNHSGYALIGLSNKKRKTYALHRIVCEAFHGTPDAGQTVNHKNGVKSDNSAANLEWCTLGENIAHAYRVGLNTPVNKKPVIQMDFCGNVINRFESIHYAARCTNGSPQRIWGCCNGQRKSSGGFKWVYA